MLLFPFAFCPEKQKNTEMFQQHELEMNSLGIFILLCIIFWLMSKISFVYMASWKIPFNRKTVGFRSIPLFFFLNQNKKKKDQIGVEKFVHRILF